LKKLFLHIGAGKTGTSAIQSQLAINKLELEKNNYYYPEANNDDAAKDFKITSGNAIELGLLLKKQTIDKWTIERLISEYIKYAKMRDVILSSEVLEDYNIENAKAFKETANTLGYEVIIIYYIRAIADHAVSAYHQHIKRNKYIKDFSFMIKRGYQNRFLTVIRKSSSTFGRENIIVKNYDYVKENIFKDFLSNILKISNIENFKIDNRKVNRSLTDFEIALMRHMNVFFNQNTQSTFVSNALIHNSPKIRYKSSIVQKDLDDLAIIYEKEIKVLNHFLEESERPLQLVNNLRIVDETVPVRLNPFQESVFAILSEVIKELKK